MRDAVSAMRDAMKFVAVDLGASSGRLMVGVRVAVVVRDLDVSRSLK